MPAQIPLQIITIRKWLNKQTLFQLHELLRYYRTHKDHLMISLTENAIKDKRSVPALRSEVRPPAPL